MKRFFAALAFSLLAFPSFTFAEEDFFQSTQQYATFPSGDDAYIFGSIIPLDQEIKDDLYTAGSTVNIQKAVGGDLGALGGSLQVLDDVEDDARLLGGDIIVSGKIGDDLLVAGETILIRSTAEVEGNAWIIGEKVTIEGVIFGNVKIWAKELHISAPVEGDAQVNTNTLSLGENGVFGGDLILKAYEDVHDEKVGGQKSFHQKEVDTRSEFVRRVQEMGTPSGFLFMLSSLFLGALVIYFARNYMATYARHVRKNPFTEMGIGFLVLTITPLAFFVLLLSFVGAPLALILALLYAVFLLLAAMLKGFVVGAFLFSIKKTSSFWYVYGAFSVGTLLVWMVDVIPYIGGFISFFLFLISLGTLARCHHGIYSALKKTKKI